MACPVPAAADGAQSQQRCVLASACVDDARACKDETERELMRRSSQINDIVMERASAWIREGMTEREIADYIVSQYAAEGCDAMAFQPLFPLAPMLLIPTMRRIRPA